MTCVQTLDKRQPRYARLAQQLEQDIATGRYPVDTYLPTEAKLCDLYTVSRFTVREAMRRLQALGLISRQQGIGTRVIADRSGGGYVHSTSSIDELLQYAVETRLAKTNLNDVTADNSLAAKLRCPVGQKFLHINGVRVSADDKDDKPISVTDVYVIEKYADIRTHIPDHVGAIANLIRAQFGENIREIQQEIEAVTVDDDMASHLQIAPNAAAFRTQRWYIGRDGSPFQITFSTRPGEGFRYEMRLRRDDT